MRHDKLLMDHVALHKQLWTKTTLEQFGLIPGTSYSSFLKNSDIFTFGAARLGQLGQRLGQRLGQARALGASLSLRPTESCFPHVWMQ